MSGGLCEDYLNFRYHDKRAAYVGELHRQLSLLMEGHPVGLHGVSCACRVAAEFGYTRVLE